MRQSRFLLVTLPKIHIYRVGQKSKLLILSKYVNKSEKMRNVNKSEQLQRNYFYVEYLTSQLFYV